MTDFERYSLIVSVIVLVVAVATLVAYFRQLRVMSAQLVAVQEAAKAQSALMLVQHLQASDARAARSMVRARLSQLELANWTQEDRSTAALVAANYDVAAALIKSGVAPLELIADNWGPSIVHCHEILGPFISEIRGRPGGCATYWSNFDWLANQASKRALRLL